MKIFSYFAGVPELNLVDEQKLILVWREKWTEAGFEPVVLNEYMAQKHPYFGEYQDAVSKFPTINPKKYELACWLRWVAVAQAGKDQPWCILSDYDVLPLPNKSSELQTQLTKERNKLTVFQIKNICPSLVGGKPEHFLEMAHYFANYKLRDEDKQGVDGERKSHGQTVFHTSDQYVLEWRTEVEPASVECVDLVRGYTEQESHTCCIHFSNSAMGPLNLKPRYQFIPGILETLA